MVQQTVENSKFMHKRELKGRKNRVTKSMVHFTVACLVAEPVNRSEAKGDFVALFGEEELIYSSHL